MDALEQLVAEARALLREVAQARVAPDAARLATLTERTTELRGAVETASLDLPEARALGLLADAAAALWLCLRAAQAGDDDRASDNWEQAGYYLDAAEQATPENL
jgi:hypothetical protein